MNLFVICFLRLVSHPLSHKFESLHKPGPAQECGEARARIVQSGGPEGSPVCAQHPLLSNFSARLFENSLSFLRRFGRAFDLLTRFAMSQPPHTLEVVFKFNSSATSSQPLRHPVAPFHSGNWEWSYNAIKRTAMVSCRGAFSSVSIASVALVTTVDRRPEFQRVRDSGLGTRKFPPDSKWHLFANIRLPPRKDSPPTGWDVTARLIVVFAFPARGPSPAAPRPAPPRFAPAGPGRASMAGPTVAPSNALVILRAVSGKVATQL